MISSRRLRCSSVALLALVLTVIVVPAVSAAPCAAEPIVTARHRALGSTVTVCGTVTVPTNAFDPGFAVQQGAAGIYVLDSGSASRALGDEVEITGTLVDSFGLLAIQPTAITAHGHGHHVQPHPRSTGSVGEATEGRLLRLEGDMVGDLIDDGPFGFKLNIDDGSGPIQIFLFPGTGITTAGLHAGVSIEVVCFSNQFETTFECDPRQPGDLEIE
jgi:hypothetical protein